MGVVEELEENVEERFGVSHNSAVCVVPQDNLHHAESARENDSDSFHDEETADEHGGVQGKLMAPISREANLMIATVSPDAPQSQHAVAGGSLPDCFFSCGKVCAPSSHKGMF